MVLAARIGAWAKAVGKKTPYIMLNQGVIRVPRSDGWNKIELEFTNGNYPTVSSNIFLCGFNNYAYQYYDYRGGSLGAENWIGYTNRVKTQDGKRHQLSVEVSKEGTIDDVIVRPGWKIDFSDLPNFFVGYHRIGGVDFSGTWIGKVYGVSVYDSDGVLLARYVPDKSGTLKNESTGELLVKLGTISYGEE